MEVFVNYSETSQIFVICYAKVNLLLIRDAVYFLCLFLVKVVNFSFDKFIVLNKHFCIKNISEFRNMYCHGHQ